MTLTLSLVIVLRYTYIMQQIVLYNNAMCSKWGRDNGGDAVNIYKCHWCSCGGIRQI